MTLVDDAQAAHDAALARHADRADALDAAKAKCLTECADLAAAITAAETPEARETAVWAEEAAHEAHREELEAAYAAFGELAHTEVNLRRAKAGFGPARRSNPAPAGETGLSADVVVTSEDPEPPAEG